MVICSVDLCAWKGVGGKLKASGLYYNTIRFILLQVTLRYVQDWRKARMVLSKIQKGTRVKYVGR